MGQVVIKGEELKSRARGYYRLRLEGNGFATPYLFYRLHKQLSNQHFVAIYESETSKQQPDGKHPFKDADIHVAALFPEEDARPAMIEVYQWCVQACADSLGATEVVTKLWAACSFKRRS